MMEMLLKQEVYSVVGAAMDVYNELKSGFLESVYQEAMEVELGRRLVPYQRQVPLRIRYKNVVLEKTFIADLICYSAVLAELKAVEQLTSKDEAQVLNYLRATQLRVGLLINFGNPTHLEWKRLVL